MALAILFNPPESDRELQEFSFANADSHTRIVNKLFDLGVVLDLPVLDPIPGFDRSSWLQRHQQVHNTQNAALGIQGSDLSQLDFDDPRQVSAWITLHAEEHRKAENRLGIG